MEYGHGPDNFQPACDGRGYPLRGHSLHLFPWWWNHAIAGGTLRERRTRQRRRQPGPSRGTELEVIPPEAVLLRHRKLNQPGTDAGTEDGCRRVSDRVRKRPITR